ncbi:MAG: hypothetical protein ABSC42_00630 [Tepidisphaeraceae bacterium]
MPEWIGLVSILIVGMVIRISDWPQFPDWGDPVNYSIGALYTHVAHPPGYVGYCLLLGWVNDLVHDIKTTLILVNVCAAIVATFLCHRVAHAVGLRGAAALAAASLYWFSVNTLHASLYGGPHVFEGLMSLLFGLLAIRAIQRKSISCALAASIVIAAAGSFRPTTTILLLPLWLYVIWRSDLHPLYRRLGQVAVHGAIVASIVAAWSWANNHYMTAQGYGGTTYQDQVVSSTTYDYDNLSGNAVGVRGAPRATFHMPVAELLAWIEVKTGLRLIPHVPGWPTPSLGRVIRLSGMQLVKQTWWLVFSLPIIVVLPVFALLRPSWLARPPRETERILSLWILPAVTFFIVGHMGILTYLQIYLGPMSVATTYFLLGNPRKQETPGDVPADSNNASPHAPPRSLLGAVILGSLALSVGFYVFSRPFNAPSGTRRLLDIAALQFDGYSRRMAFTTSRNEGNTDVPESSAPSVFSEYRAARTDRELLDVARRNQFLYARFPPSSPSTGP